MAKPEETKEAKPKAEGEETKKAKAPIDDNMKIIIINLATTVLICILFLSVTYVMMSSLITSKLSHVANMQGHASDEANELEESEGEGISKGFIVDLGDFILNLSDVSSRKYLKVNVALEVSSRPEDAVAAEESAGGHGGHGGGAPAVNPLEEEMAQYKPAIRDAVITTLSSKTSSELATVAGKELAKEQITEAVNGIFAGQREVLRVSFGQFIIQ